jgi:hypothetical protein
MVACGAPAEAWGDGFITWATALDDLVLVAVAAGVTPARGVLVAGVGDVSLVPGALPR